MNFKKLTLPVLSLSSLVLHAEESRPNILLFLVDDMGWSDTSVPFDAVKNELNNRYETPNMERLAARGMKFCNAYASSVSSPTRVSLMTGVEPATHRVTNWTLYRDKSSDGACESLILPAWNVNGLQPVDTIPSSYYATTLPEILHRAGYTTMLVGKAHFGAMDTPGADPLNFGFDHNIAGHAAGGLGSYLGEQNYGNTQPGTHTPPWGVPGLEKYHGTNTFITDALTNEAISLIDKNKSSGKPFFLYMSHYAVHIPFSADNRFYDKYRNKGLDHTESMYASIVEAMDKSLGDLMDALEERGIADNTVILFMSDNGGLSATGRGDTKDHNNRPLRSGKGSAYEGGVRVPMILSWKGVTPEGSSNKTTVAIHDFLPTIAAIAGVKKTDTRQKIDGKSFVNRIHKEKPYCGTLHWHYPNEWGLSGDGIGASSSILEGAYKYIYFYKEQRGELYNIKDDLSETNNLAIQPEYKKRTKQLHKKLFDYLQKRNAQTPTPIES